MNSPECVLYLTPVRSAHYLAILAITLVALPLSSQQPVTTAPGVTITGQVFLQYGYGLQVDSTLASPGHPNNFDVTRTFVNFLGHFDDGISSRVTLDVDARKATANELSMRLAYAFVGWQPNGRGPLTWKMGLMHTPWVEWEETVWDYRMQGKSVLDRNGYSSISDFGAGVDGNWNNDRVNMQAGVYNGEGSTNGLGDQGKDFEARVSVRLMATDLPGRVGGLRLSGFAQVGTATGGGERRRFLGMLSYKSKTLTLAALMATTQDSLVPALPHQRGSVISAFGVYDIPRTRFAAVLRLDSYDPNADSTSQLINSAANVAVNTQTRVIAGVSYTASPHLRVLADADLVSIENGATNAFNRTRQMLYFQSEVRF
jgi:hypothetical protein